MPQAFLETLTKKTISFDFDEDDNYFQIMSKIYSTLPDEYNIENLRIIIGNTGKILTRKNFEDFKGSAKNFILLKIQRKIRLVTDQIDLSSYYDALNEYIIEKFLNGETDLILERDNGNITLSLDGDFINIRVNLEDIKLTFTIEKEDIIDQLIDQAR